MKKTIWVLRCSTNSDEESMQAFTTKRAAQRGMHEEIETEQRNLISSGHGDNYRCTSGDLDGSLYVIGGDIYFDWQITLCDIIDDHK